MAASAPTSDRVAEILAAACRVIVREGAHGLRMASVAAEAGVSKALVHYYFSTRRELLRSAFAWSEERWRAAVASEVAPLATAAERLERTLLMSIDADPRFSDQRALWNEVWSSLRYDETLRPAVDAFYRAWVEQLVAHVVAGRSDGSVPAAVDAEAAGWRLAAVADGLDSMIYVGLLDRAAARDLMLDSLRRELA